MLSYTFTNSHSHVSEPEPKGPLVTMQDNSKSSLADLFEFSDAVIGGKQ